MKLNKNIQFLNSFILCVLLIFQVIDNIIRDVGYYSTIFSVIKNVILLFSILIYLYEIYHIKKEKIETIFDEELRSILLLALIFALLSLYYIVKNKGFNMVTITGLQKMILPIIAAYAVLNIMSLKQVYNVMVIFLMFSIITFLYAKKEYLNIESILSIDFLSSYSVFESNFFSPTAISLCIFFGYYRHKKLWLILSVIFSVLTFKRIIVIYALFLLLFGGLFKKVKKVNSFVVYIFNILFLAIIVLYIQLIQGKYDLLLYKYLGMSMNEFSMGRGWLFQNLLYSNFENYGFYSSTISIRSIEMDLLMIYVEMGVLAVIASVFFITKIGKQSYYNFIVVAFCLLELLTSHWFDITYYWIIMYITLGCIAYKNIELNFLVKSKRKIRFKIRRR